MPTYQCPTCGKTVRVQRREDASHRPFCSHRCQMIDLSKWFDGEYRISEPLDPHQTPEPNPDNAPPREIEN